MFQKVLTARVPVFNSGRRCPQRNKKVLFARPRSRSSLSDCDNPVLGIIELDYEIFFFILNLKSIRSSKMGSLYFVSTITTYLVKLIFHKSFELFS